MKTASSLFQASRTGRLSSAACLIALVGLPRRALSRRAAGHDEDHVGHVIPAHKPKTFPDAVRRLRELNDQIGRIVAEGQPRLVDRREDA